MVALSETLVADYISLEKLGKTHWVSETRS